MNYSVTVNETGEQIKNVSRIVTNSQEKMIEEFKKRKKLYNKISEHCGNFYFYRYDKLLKTINDDTATAFRFLYVCTCADGDGKIVAYDKTYCSNISDFTYVFEKARGTVQKYVNDLTNYKLVYKEDGVYKVNPFYYSTDLKDKGFKHCSIRTFNNAVRELYRNSNPEEHKLMGLLIKLSPYINVSNNIICWNVDKTNIEEIQPFTRQEIQHVLKPNTNYNYELLNKLENVLIKGELVIGRFEAGGIEHYKINPRLFYCGNNLEDLKSLIYSFDLTTHQYKEKNKKKKMVKGEN